MTQQLPGRRMQPERWLVAAIISAIVLSGVIFVAFDQEWAKSAGSGVVAVLLVALLGIELRRRQSART